jgi:microcystin-dependent protein
MAVKITDLPAESAPSADDLVILRDNATGTTKKIPIGTLLLAFSDLYSPTGAVTNFAGATAPSGWLMCDGSAVDRTTYDDLFAIVSTIYGAGNGTTTFNLPDMRGKVPVGKAASGTFNNLNNTGGEENHTLSVGEMPAHAHDHNNPAHSHSLNDGGHSHRIAGFGTSGSYGLVDSAHATSSGANVRTSNDGTGISVNASGISLAISNTGGGAAHNNLQPYRVLNFIIKV